MKNTIQAVRRYLRLLAVFAKFSLMSQLEYRINFISGVMVECGWMLIKLIYVAVVYRAGTNIGVLTPDHFLLFVGTYVLMTGIYMLIYPNLVSLSDKVREGGLDMYLVKPISLQFLATMERLNFALLFPNFTVGALMIAAGWHRAGLPVNAGAIAGFCFYMLCGILLTYSLFLLPHMACFWIVSTRGIQTLTDALWDFNNMPQMVYGRWLQRIGTFILPVFVVTNFPGLFLMGELTPGMAVWGVAAPVIFFFVSRAVWKRAVKNYSSASS